jgi:hypothetical protein
MGNTSVPLGHVRASWHYEDASNFVNNTAQLNSSKQYMHVSDQHQNKYSNQYKKKIKATKFTTKLSS